MASAVENRLEARGFKVVGKYFIQNNRGFGVIAAIDPEMPKHIGETGEQTIVGASIRVGV